MWPLVALWSSAVAGLCLQEDVCDSPWSSSDTDRFPKVLRTLSQHPQGMQRHLYHVHQSYRKMLRVQNLSARVCGAISSIFLHAVNCIHSVHQLQEQNISSFPNKTGALPASELVCTAGATHKTRKQI